MPSAPEHETWPAWLVRQLDSSFAKFLGGRRQRLQRRPVCLPVFAVAERQCGLVAGYAVALTISHLLNSRFVFPTRLSLSRYWRFSYVPISHPEPVCSGLFNWLGWHKLVFTLAAIIGVPVTFLLLKFFACAASTRDVASDFQAEDAWPEPCRRRRQRLAGSARAGRLGAGCPLARQARPLLLDRFGTSSRGDRRHGPSEPTAQHHHDCDQNGADQQVRHRTLARVSAVAW